MGVLSDMVQQRSAMTEVVKRAADEDFQKAAEDRGAQVKAAIAAAKKKYPDGVPPAVRKQIFKDPAGWLKSNSSDSDSDGE